ncbi:MAG: 1-deoxy-D-xylulose-5-phosphate synthase [Clostridiales Family XIII bacterium]|jgi:1-deoxy-D-xylulose-5-phosphate synthase|nr:1-deoxy-D-xylulose-5-phosphate synthase [Clostridiales Family XIII bacterium]
MLKKDLTEYNFPEDLKGMSVKELELLSVNIRDFLISSVAKTGGHLASNLGAVELTVALHKVFDVPRDKIVWDVGHQTYVHKILTGRADQFDTLRQLGGISGFPKRQESPADVFDSGHSSTSISAAMGLAEARDLRGGTENIIAVIGDGAMTGGAAFEGMNNAGMRKTRMIVVLNDNAMSISQNTGSIARHLRRLRASQRYQDMKASVKKNIIRVPGVGDTLYSGLEHAKDLIHYAVVNECIFEALGFHYYGPVDGHSIVELTRILENSKRFNEPILLHVVTTKGKGYRNAELNPQRFHGIGPFKPETGQAVSAAAGPSYSKVAGETLVRLAEEDERVVSITAAMTDGTGLTPFAERFPKRFFDVGIAEQHAVSFSAGLALGGLRPFVCIYSSFLQRAYDQLVMDIGMQRLPVVFLIDRAGCVGQDGETHHGVFDLSYLTAIPGMTVLAPSSGTELMRMMKYALAAGDGPVAIRYPRGVAGEDIFPEVFAAPDEAKGFRLKRGAELVILSVGTMGPLALSAAELLKADGTAAQTVDVKTVKPLDTKMLASIGRKGLPVLTIEDNVITGGYGQDVQAFFSQGGYANRVHAMGWPDEFVGQGGTAELMAAYGLTAEAAYAHARALLGK